MGGAIFVPKAATVALWLYQNTGAILVGGPKITGSDPPVPAAATQARIDWTTGLGIPSSAIAWMVIGEAAS